MKNRIARFLGVTTIVLGCADRSAIAQETPDTKETPVPTARSFYDHEVKTIDGRTVSLSDYKGKVCVVVNTASL